MKKLFLITLLSIIPLSVGAVIINPSIGNGDTLSITVNPIDCALTPSNPVGNFYNSVDDSLPYIYEYTDCSLGTSSLNNFSLLTQGSNFDQLTYPICVSGTCQITMINTISNLCAGLSKNACLLQAQTSDSASFTWQLNPPAIENNQTSWGLLFTVMSITIGLTFLMAIL